MPTRYVKINGPYLVPGETMDARRGVIGGHETLNPGSVVAMEEDFAKDFVKRGLGTMHGGPESKAPAPAHGGACKADGTFLDSRTPWQVVQDQPERADLGAKLANAERAVAAPQLQRSPR